MRLRHVAAFALVGFYLITPPVTESGLFVAVDPRLSLSMWDIQGTFDTKDECEKQRAQLKEDNPEPTGPWHRGDAVRNSQAQALRNGQCVSTDDPRLKKK
jgi:hypothetical protein